MIKNAVKKLDYAETKHEKQRFVKSLSNLNILLSFYCLVHFYSSLFPGIINWILKFKIKTEISPELSIAIFKIFL